MIWVPEWCPSLVYHALATANPYLSGEVDYLVTYFLRRAELLVDRSFSLHSLRACGFNSFRSIVIICSGALQIKQKSTIFAAWWWQAMVAITSGILSSVLLVAVSDTSEGI